MLEPSLLHEVDVTAGLAADGVLIVNTETPPEDAASRGLDVRCVPAGNHSPNLVLAGAVAGATGVPLEAVVEAAVELLGRKLTRAEIATAVQEGYGCLVC